MDSFMASSIAPAASSASPVKILTVGSALGSIRDLFVKIKAIDAKHGKFDCVLCVGDFFGPLKESGDKGNGTDETEQQQLLNGDIEVPLKCYIMQGDNPLPDSVIEKYTKTSGELCKDVFLLSKSGIMTTPHGLRIACLGGIYNPGIYTTAEAPPGFASPFFSTHTVERLLSNTLVKSSSKPQAKNQAYTSLTSILNASSSSQLIDILITNDWPACITQHSSAPLPSPDLSSLGSPPLDEVIRKVKPRYHFSALGGRPPQFWEREPFVWNDEAGRVSRFVSLGAFGAEATGGKKPRWFYAFSITPPSPSDPAPARPANATKNPFTELAPRVQKRALETLDEGQNFIWGNVPQGKRSRIDAPQGEQGKPPPGYKCRRCDSIEHFISSCPERQQPPEGYVCRVCNTPGHLVRDCPTRHAVGDTGGRKPRPGYVCRACASEGHYIEDCPVANAGQRGGEREGGRGRGRREIKEIGPDECWFCLSNPNIAKHLIVSIGTECYVTLPKGQVIPTQSAADESNNSISTVPGGGHVLIVPISHHPTFSTIPVDIAPPILDETEKYKSSLRTLYAAHDARAVFFEVGRLSTKGGHAHVQAVPVPTSLAGKVEQAFRSQGIDFNGTLEDCRGAGIPGARSYFRVDLPDGKTLVHLIEEHVPFGVQFGRQVLADVLDIPDRVDWKACMLPEEEDKADVKAFKTAFASFDPSM